MNIFGQWKVFYLFLIPFAIYGALHYWGFNIAAYSPFSNDYNPTLIFPNSLVITVFSTLFIVSFGWYFGYNLEQYKLTLRTYSSIIEAIKSVSHSVTPSEGVEIVYDEDLELLKLHLLELPRSIFNQLKVDDKNGLFAGMSYSTSIELKRGISNYLVQKKEGLKLINIMFEDSNIEKSYIKIFDLISEIHGINYADCPEFLSRTVVITCLVLNTILIFYDWAAYGLYLGSGVILGQNVIFLYMLDGIKTITPVFGNGTQGHGLMKRKTDELMGELDIILAPVQKPKSKQTKPFVPKK